MSGPKNKNATRLPAFFTSITQAVSALNRAGVTCKASDLKKAKSAGCEAWKGYRIYSAPLADWIEANAPESEPDDPALESKDILERRKLAEQVKRIKNIRLAEERKLVSIAEVEREGTVLGNAIKGFVQQFVNNDLPSWAGLDSPALHAKGIEWQLSFFQYLHGVCGYVKTG